MHKHFADWYREVDFDAGTDALKAHGAVVEKMASSLTVRDAVALVPLLLSPDVETDDYVQKLCSTFKEADPAFPMKNNEHLLSVLAGALIAEAFGKGRAEAGEAAALAVTCACFLPHESRPPIADILAEAEEYLARRSHALRADLDIPVVSAKQAELGQQLKEALDQIGANPVLGNVLAPPLLAALNQLSTSLSALTNSMTRANKGIARVVGLLQEETNMLWWAFSEFSRDFKTRMNGLSVAAACVVSGKELADLVEYPPGPLSAEAILERMLLSGRSDTPNEVSLKDAVNGCSVKWREALVDGTPRDISTSRLWPVHSAVNASLATDSQDDWGPVFKKSCRADWEHSARPVRLAHQVYRERLLLNLI